MDFALYDVFCNKPFTGNQAVVIRSDGLLTPQQLLTLSNEFNLPETCVYWMFNGIPHMIFATSDNVINACGHGLLAVLADVARVFDLAQSENLSYCIKTCGFGVWKFRGCRQNSVYISVKWPRLPTFDKLLPLTETAKLLGINNNCICKNLPLEAFNSGIVNGLVPLINEKKLTELQADLGSNPKNLKRYKDYFAKYELDDLEIYCIKEKRINDLTQITIRSRNIFPYGVWEEAATGSASLSLATALFKHFGSTSLNINVTQGLSRQGNITAKIITEAETSTVWLEGRVNLIASGTDLIFPN